MSKQALDPMGPINRVTIPPIPHTCFRPFAEWLCLPEPQFPLVSP